MDSCLLLQVCMSNKYGKKLVDTAKKSDKITSISKKSIKKLPNNDEDVELTIPKKRYISPEERQQIISELRLVPKN